MKNVQFLLGFKKFKESRQNPHYCLRDPKLGIIMWFDREPELICTYLPAILPID